jgi:hypothetical protein
MAQMRWGSALQQTACGMSVIDGDIRWTYSREYRVSVGDESSLCDAG